MWNNCLKEPNFLEIILLKSLSFEIKTNPENCLTVICTGFKFNAFSDENRFKTFFLPEILKSKSIGLFKSKY